MKSTYLALAYQNAQRCPDLERDVKTNPDEHLSLVWACVARGVDLRKERVEKKPRRATNARLGFMDQIFEQYMHNTGLT
jgi:hypothetical protein